LKRRKSSLLTARSKDVRDWGAGRRAERLGASHVPARLGHSSVTITLNRYEHLFPPVEEALVPSSWTTSFRRVKPETWMVGAPHGRICPVGPVLLASARPEGRRVRCCPQRARTPNPAVFPLQTGRFKGPPEGPMIAVVDPQASRRRDGGGGPSPRCGSTSRLGIKCGSTSRVCNWRYSARHDQAIPARSAQRSAHRRNMGRW
jgi:hypothetical protein